eukprot:Rhum_TRINITY_DN23971_c0_g2::Rhum_TRINITY_DN23971_c0_g2_i1::g.179043::m.179043
MAWGFVRLGGRGGGGEVRVSRGVIVGTFFHCWNRRLSDAASPAVSHACCRPKAAARGDDAAACCAVPRGDPAGAAFVGGDSCFACIRRGDCVRSVSGCLAATAPPTPTLPTRGCGHCPDGGGGSGTAAAATSARTEPA